MPDVTFLKCDFLDYIKCFIEDLFIEYDGTGIFYFLSKVLYCGSPRRLSM